MGEVKDDGDAIRTLSSPLSMCDCVESWLEKGALTDLGGGRWGWYRTLSLALYPWRSGWVGKKHGDRKREISSLAYGNQFSLALYPCMVITVRNEEKMVGSKQNYIWHFSCVWRLGLGNKTW